MHSPLVIPSRRKSQGIRSIHSRHGIHVTVSRQIESNDHHQIREQENRALEVVTLSFSMDVRQEEHTENDSNHVPLREDQTGAESIRQRGRKGEKERE